MLSHRDAIGGLSKTQRSTGYSRTLASVAAVSVLVFGPAAAIAQPFFRAFTQADAAFTPQPPCEDIGPFPARCFSLAQASNPPGASFFMATGQGSARAGRGHLSAFSRGTATTFGPFTGTDAGGFAEAEFCISDVIVSCPPGLDCTPFLNPDGSTVTVTLNLRVSGTILSSPMVLGDFGNGFTDAEAHVEASLGCNGPLILQGTRTLLTCFGAPGVPPFCNVDSSIGIFEGFTGGNDVSSVSFNVLPGAPFTLSMLLRTSACALGSGDLTSADAYANFGHTISFPIDQPVFTVPGPFTVNSVDARIVDNQWQFPDCNNNGIPDFSEVPTTASITKLVAGDAEVNDRLGGSVAVDGDTMVVGGLGDDDACPGNPNCNSGSAHVYRFDGTDWIEEAKLTASDAAPGDEFGGSVAISGDTIVVGAEFADPLASNSGAAYVFQRIGSAWMEQAKLVPSDGAANEEFGESVSISADTIVVGADNANTTVVDSGAAYVFHRSGSNWTQQAKLVASDAAFNDEFGFSVSIDGDAIVIGAFRDDDAGSRSGSAYVYRFDGIGWIEEDKLTAFDAAPHDEFGGSVAISGDTIAVGAQFADPFADPLDPLANSNSGAAYVFQRTGPLWSQQAKLVPGDGAANEVFGQSVSISGNTIIVGAGDANTAVVDSGAAYVFLRSGSIWTEQPKLVAADAAFNDEFGTSVAVSGITIAVGVPFDDHAGGADAGSLYVFSVGGNCVGDCNGNGVPDQCEAVLGDLNCDVFVNGLDVGPFVLALLDPAQYALDFAGCDINSADINNDTMINTADIGPFTQCLLAGGCP